ncbi:MAG: hypothetical protein JWM99_1276 [Verrucomicrobiales bacterium]|nr:hypothetical protein [Verrucomicrobiales bacterium]
MTDPIIPDFRAGGTPAGPVAVPSELVLQTVRSLRRSFQYTLVLMLVLSASLFVFLLREVSAVRRQNLELGRAISDYQRVGAPSLEDFRKKLVEYAHGHPDFGPILGKYFAPTNPPPQNGPPLAPLQ